jgi:hypothetical protein
MIRDPSHTQEKGIIDSLEAILDRKDYPERVTKLGDDSDPYLAQTTPEERIEMMWPLAVQAWAFKGEDVSESRLQRHVVRVIRRKS